MKTKWILIGSIVLVAIGLVLIFRPQLGDVVYQGEVKTAQKEFNETVEQIQTTEDLEPVVYRDLLEACIAYNTDLSEHGQEDLGSQFSEAVLDLADYGIEDRIFGYIEIPRINQVLPIYLGATTANMALGAVQCGGTSLPIGSYNGESVNTVIAAHRGYNWKRYMFREIEKIQIGDEIIITNFWGTMIYTVTETRVIYPDQLENVLIQEGKDMITLSTCHPFRHNYERYLVFAERTS